VVVFHPLQKDQMSLILNILMKDIREMLTKQELQLEVTKEAGKMLVEHGFDPQFGARPLKRTLQRELINELAKHLLAGDYQKGDTVLIDADNVGLNFGRKTMVDGKEVLSKKLKDI
jgi:ATP-dependent Clp protease ATP-binding subunit ClpB